MQKNLLPAWQERHNAEHKVRRHDHRTPFQRDRARILHSAAFRRLQAKTQVHGTDTDTDDFHRTRLTHSLETAQIGTGIVAQLRLKQPEFAAILPSDSLIDSLCLAHDIGHPPFGHGGEIALPYMMHEYGGFEGNAQTFRIITQLEPYTEHYGMNLARRTQLGLIKYPALLSQTQSSQFPERPLNSRQLKASEWSPPKGIYDADSAHFDWVLTPLAASDRSLFSQLRTQQTAHSNIHRRTQFKSLDCSIMELADDIAYGVHDLEDAITMGLVSRQQWLDYAATELAHSGGEWFSEHSEFISEMLFSGKPYERKDAIGGMVNALLTSITVEKVAAEFACPLLVYNAYLEHGMDRALTILKQFVSQHVIQIPQVQIVEYRGQQIIMELFAAISGDPLRLLPENMKLLWQQANNQAEGMRVIADYLSAMTDSHAQRLYQQLFSA